MSPWVRLDDSLEGHRKRRRAGHEAFGVWCAALTYCGKYLTNGHVDRDWFEAEIPSTAKRQRVVGKLLSVGLLDHLEAGQTARLPDRRGELVEVGPFAEDEVLIHDYLAFNPSDKEVEERREKERLKKIHQRMSTDASPGDSPGDSNGDSPSPSEGTPRARASRSRTHTQIP